MKYDPAITENIIDAAMRGDFHACVMPSDPAPERSERMAAVNDHLSERARLSYRMKRFVAERMADTVLLKLSKSIQIIGEGKLSDISGGAIVTVNHFSPYDSIPVRKLLRGRGGKLNIVIKDTNLFMNGPLGFLMKYARTLPVTDDAHYLSRSFYPTIEKMLLDGEYVLIYPEAQMWPNYRKPRPLEPGAYHYAARLGVPIIPLFTEIISVGGYGRESFDYRLHVGDPIYPDMALSQRERAELMRERDSSFKISAYERAYQRPFKSEYSDGDVAGSAIRDPYITELFEPV